MWFSVVLWFEAEKREDGHAYDWFKNEVKLTASYEATENYLVVPDYLMNLFFALKLVIRANF